MGHYDNCRPGHCAICGQTGNLCGHNAMNPEDKAEKLRRLENEARKREKIG